MAVLLNNEIPGIRAFRTIFYLPVILAGGPAILLAWRYMLTDNGGFVNEALQKFAQSFFVFDYLYRIYIYISESANGFYLGFANGDPVGPFKYVVPGLIMILLLLTLALGDWEESKRQRSLAFAQILGLITVYRLASKGLMAQPVNVSWIYFGAVLVLAGITHRAWQGKKDRLMRGLGILGLVGLALLLFYQVDFDITNRYWIALGVVAATLIGTLIGPWNRFKLTIFSAIIAALCVLIFVRAIPGELNGGRYQVLSKYLVFGSTIAHPHDENYLENVYPFESMSAMWIWGLGAAVLVLGAILNNGYPRARRYLLWGALIFFVLFTAGAFMDGRAYFNAFEEAAKIAGNKNFHFARFHESFDDFPTSQRVPKWMSSELWTKPSLILITMWSSGAGMLIFLAALKGVPESLYEAAKVDGASSVQRFFRITLPMISPAMFYNLVIGIIAALQTFDTIYILQNTNTESSLASAAYYLFNRTFRQLAVGDGAAMSWILVVIILTLTVLQFRFSRNWVHYEA
jgi:ABC-type sugar transport system permease subunit